jgi:two-component system cell cycle sensor histidine kinase/response regulator CckA
VFWIRDVATNRITYVSPGYDGIWGEPPAALYAAPEHFAATLHPDDRARVMRAAREKQTVGAYDEVFRIVRPDGGQRWIHSKGFPVRNAAGTVYRIAGVAADITAQKQHEEQSLRNQRLESVGLLAAGITHDLNNVLAPISMVVTLLRPQLSRPMDLRLLDTLEKCASRGTGLVRQILGFAHGVKGEQRIVQVAHLLHDIVQVVTETFPKSILLDEQVPAGLWPIQANPTQIHQVLLNLCVNARDAMPQGGTLLLRAANCSLDHAAARAIDGASMGDWLVLEVGDTGTGIPPEILARIWDPFFTTKATGAGTGLGLSTVRGIVETCHGFITLRTEAGRGTTICIYLPALLEVEEDADTAQSLAQAPGNGELILLVDDEESIRELAGTTLTQAGYKVITAVDGFAAMQLFEAHSSEVALVITDLDMPNMNGESLRHIIHTFRPTLKILTMSGNGSNRPPASEPGLAASAHIAKPFTVQTLLTQVQRLLRGAGSRTPLLAPGERGHIIPHPPAPIAASMGSDRPAPPPA